MKFSEFPFLRYLFFFVIGIFLYPLLPIHGFYWVCGLLLFMGYAFVVIYTAFQKKFTGKYLLPGMGYALLVWAGWFFSFQNDPLNQPNHLYHQDNYEAYLAIVEELDLQKPKTKANTLFILATYQEGLMQKATGKVLIYHQLIDTLRPGHVVLVKGQARQVSPPTNPNEFDYRAYLEKQEVFHTHFVGKELLILDHLPAYRPLHAGIIGLRAKLKSNIHRFVKDEQARQIAEALLLGQKQDLDPNLKEAYVTAGAMHILAVSGLHVGIIYGFFFLLIKPYRLKWQLRAIYLSAVILLIWGYALLTGMSPSVMRAATMFTLIGLAQMKSRSPSIFNPLALSALLLLMYDPNLIYAVGFQLSYAALTGILLFQPLIVKCWLPKNKVLEYAWQITSVGLAAQLATFPISAYYFHVFPSYFILSNLIAIPGAFLIMSLGIPFLLFSWVPGFGGFLGLVLGIAIQLLNRMISFIQGLPFSRISDIHISPEEIVLYLIFLVCAYELFANKRKWAAWSILAVVCAHSLFMFLELEATASKKELYIYDLGKSMVMDFYDGPFRYSGTLGQVNAEDISYKVLPHRLALKGLFAAPLVQKETDFGFDIYLPNLEVLQVSLNTVKIPKASQAHSYKGGRWEIFEGPTELKLENTAYKIDF